MGMREHNPHFAAYYRRLVLTHTQTSPILDVGYGDGFFNYIDRAGTLKWERI